MSFSFFNHFHVNIKGLSCYKKQNQPVAAINQPVVKESVHLYQMKSLPLLSIKCEPINL